MDTKLMVERTDSEWVITLSVDKKVVSTKLTKDQFDWIKDNNVTFSIMAHKLIKRLIEDIDDDKLLNEVTYKFADILALIKS